MPGLFDPNSPQAGAIANNFLIVLGICTVILVVVVGLIATFVVKHRRKNPNDPDPVQVYGNTRLEIGWTIVPLVIVAGLFVMSINTMNAAAPTPAPDRIPDIVVTGHQWWWEAHYPTAKITTANEIHIPTGKDLLIRVESADVIHDFWVAELGPKVDAVPGHPNHTWIRADKPGHFIGVCAEFCGTQHAWMLFDVIAESPAEFDVWLLHEASNAIPPATDQQKRGEELFMRHTCRNCHAVRGTQAVARVAPDLTHFARRLKLGSGVADNTSENLLRWMQNPNHIKPGSNMPNFQFTDKDAADMSAYLGALK